MNPTQAVEAFLQRPALKRSPRRLMVALSGGADSVALLLACVEAAPRLAWTVEALHCDHGLRGRDSDKDAAFARALCAKLKVPLHAFSASLGAGPGLEERARGWRRACYAQAAQEAGANLILLGHHARDQAETLLLNLVRGSGPNGAAAMLPLVPLNSGVAMRSRRPPAAGRRFFLGRPFLSTAPESLRSWLRARKQPWREDRSNRDPSFARNRLRLKVLPELERINPRAAEHLAAFAAALAPRKRASGLAALLRLDKAARERAGAALAKGAGRVDLGAGWTLELGSGQAHVAAPEAGRLDLTRPGTWNWGSWRFELKLGVPGPRKLLETGAFWFSPELLKSGARLRPLKAGERLAPFGFSGRRKAADLLREAGVARWNRTDWPALEAEGRLLALPGVRRGQGFEARPGKSALRFSWVSQPVDKGPHR